MNAPRVCYLNGEFLPLAEARVSVLDRGFIFGDAVYEVLVARGGRLFALREHLARLARSLLEVALANPLGAAEWQAMLERLVAANGGGDLSVYIQVTRGVAERDHGYPADTPPTVFAMCRPLEAAAALMRVQAHVIDDNRWRRCDIKSTSLLPNVLLRNQALAAGAYEAILVRDGWLTEGAASNVFVVHGGRVRTPPLSEFILPGVTRALLIDALTTAGFDIAEAPVPASDLRNADEIWLTSTTRDIISVSLLDGVPVGPDRSCALAEKARTVFQAYKTARLAGER